MLEDSADDLYENAPCGNLSTLLDGTIARINRTLLGWLGYGRDEVVGRLRFSDLLTVGGKIYYETHYAPLLSLQGEVGGVALDLRAKDGRKLPVLVTSAVKTGDDGRPLLIRTTVYDARDRRAYEEELLRARRAAEAAERAAHEDRQRLQKLVEGLQRSLLPQQLPVPPAMDVAAHYQAASADEVGGDFYDLFPLGGDRWGFFLGDVCGKGVEAAAVTALARYTLRAATVYDPDPAQVLSNLNTVLYQEYLSDDHRFCTVVFGILGPATTEGRCLTVTGGGHPPALLLTAAGTAEYVPTSGGPLVGMLPGLQFTTHTYLLRPADTLIVYTDGLTDARIDDANGRYSHEALLEFAASIAPASATAAVASLAGLLAGFGAGLDDDAAVMALTVTP
ncbi:PP2C family protein-serine/threonine phosphatase [Catellatospora bangladeshensis]|uniref:Histidine kinase n=1 Tax=Catellatospora bangladeshensis TaxID=310355 RepID=A0A8J3JYB7_9ACTN|nr:SpoIIE family protein phosphatase [Catellatospora bangladeshensis]GIF85924.1 histidine kinase [Catellatospora bangladeshensis]